VLVPGAKPVRSALGLTLGPGGTAIRPMHRQAGAQGSHALAIYRHTSQAPPLSRASMLAKAQPPETAATCAVLASRSAWGQSSDYAATRACNHKPALASHSLCWPRPGTCSILSDRTAGHPRVVTKVDGPGAARKGPCRGPSAVCEKRGCGG
jgi:hypothetical protein